MADHLTARSTPTVEDIEIQLLLEGIALHYGYDFRDYAPGPLRRNIAIAIALEGAPTISRYQERILHDPEAMARFLNAVGAGATTLFREPDSLVYLRQEVVPWLRTFPSVRVWVVGCSTGEDVVSLAISLHETGILHRTRIYATDINERSLAIARTRRYPLENVRKCEAGYLRAGGSATLSDYYRVSRDTAQFDHTLLANVTWARHNVATEASFNDFHVILCTNVLGQFSAALQRRVDALLFESLVPSGYLIAGTAGDSAPRLAYQPVDELAGLYRKVRA